jgi:enolase-phosphatase E1
LRIECDDDRRQGHNPPEWHDEIDSSVAYMHWLMDQDRKSTALKSLQGKIWEAGYRAEELQGDVYADVPRAFARWRDEGRTIAIFSSGSVLAQQLIFCALEQGRSVPFHCCLLRHDDRTKKEAESYTRIANELGFFPAEILFCSDIGAELDAARRAGFQTALCVREGAAPVGNDHRVIHTFDEL